ncbi:MAG: hypothetical protein DRI57_19765 [Deltaproteobacteria bacterium]|nr:MAG: hypothetical protein DRI57_19765 [Deltaproteobacteria bacterium]
MNLKVFTVLFLACCVLFSAQASFGEEKAQSVSESQTASEPEGRLPIAFITSDKFEFPSVIEGSEVTNNFIIQNKGTAPLKITRVKTG